MIDALFGALLSVFVWSTFSVMLLGILIGFLVGILPGLSGPVALAIMLRFVFDMGPLETFAFLLGAQAVIATTGDISSILFGVPGESTSAALILDGHQMARNGEAGRALGASLMSSLVGAVFGALILAMLIPVIGPVVLALGSPEFFMLAVLGMTLVGILSGDVPLKGLIAGGAGLMLSTVGLDPQTSTQRYTLGLLELWDGIGLVSVTAGLFAIPEIVDLATSGTSIARQRVGKIGGVVQGVRDTFVHFWLTLRSSAIGTVLGIIPGLGGAATQWVTYAHAVQSSRDKSRFGKGAVEGVIAPSAANNSVLGGTLVTMVLFGVPVTVSTAILLGAFLIQGLVPGPSMLTEHLQLTLSFVWIVIIANFITVGICFLFLQQIARATLIRGGLLVPLIIVLIYVGAYSEKNSILDLFITLVFGLIGIAMVRLGWPRPPLLLGLVLGGFAERYLFISVGRFGADFLTRPVVLGLIALCVLVVAYSLRASARRPIGDVPPNGAGPASPSGLRTTDGP